MRSNSDLSGGARRVLVLGADEIVGRRIVAALRQTDWAAPIEANGDSAAIGPALNGIDCIVNTVSGAARTVREHGSALFGSPRLAGRKIPIVHLSSMTVYGDATGTVTEEHTASRPLGAYAAAKLEVERRAEDYGAATILRLGCEYGPGCWQWSGRVARWLIARRLGDLGAPGDGYCNLVHVDDIAAAVVSAARSQRHDVERYNLAAPLPPTWNDYFRRFAKALHAVPLRRVSRRRLAWETRIAAPPLKMAELTLRFLGARNVGLPPAIPASMVALCGQEIILGSRKAEAAFDMRWTALDIGLAQTAQAIRNR